MCAKQDKLGENSALNTLLWFESLAVKLTRGQPVWFEAPSTHGPPDGSAYAGGGGGLAAPDVYSDVRPNTAVREMAKRAEERKRSRQGSAVAAGGSGSSVGSADSIGTPGGSRRNNRTPRAKASQGGAGSSGSSSGSGGGSVMEGVVLLADGSSAPVPQPRARRRHPVRPPEADSEKPSALGGLGSGSSGSPALAVETVHATTRDWASDVSAKLQSERDPTASEGSGAGSGLGGGGGAGRGTGGKGESAGPQRQRKAGARRRRGQPAEPPVPVGPYDRDHPRHAPGQRVFGIAGCDARLAATFKRLDQGSEGAVCGASLASHMANAREFGGEAGESAAAAAHKNFAELGFGAAGVLLELDDFAHLFRAEKHYHGEASSMGVLQWFEMIANRLPPTGRPVRVYACA